MKKILLIILTIIIVAGIGFGVYFFKFSKGDENNLTIAEARNLINTVYEDMGYNTKDESIENKDINLYGLNSTEYTSDEIDYHGYQDFVKGFIFMAKYSFESDGIKEETFYSSTASYEMHGKIYSATAKMYFKLKQNKLEFHGMDPASNKQFIIVLDNNSNAENKWKLTFTTFSTLKGGDGISVLEISANTKNVFAFMYSELKTTDGIYDLITANDVEMITLYKCNIETNERIEAEKKDFSETELVEYGMKVIDAVNATESVDFEGKIGIDVDFLTRMYVAIGYITK